MSGKDHCKLSVSTCSMWGKVDRWLFGDFLKYSKNNLVSEKPELVIETFNQETKVQNPIVLNRGPHPSLRKKNLKDAAMFTYCEKSDRPILDLQVSPYLRSVIEDDYKAGNNIHIFDLEFRNEYQLEKEFSVQGMSPSLTDPSAPLSSSTSPVMSNTSASSSAPATRRHRATCPVTSSTTHRSTSSSSSSPTWASALSAPWT